MAALSMSAGALGNARTQTLRAFSETEIKTVLGRRPDCLDENQQRRHANGTCLELIRLIGSSQNSA